MKYILLFVCMFVFVFADCQNTKLKLEGYAAPGFFFEHLSNDSLVPPEKRKHARLGNVASYAIQIAAPLKNQRWLIKGGVGFSQRHYSLSKYSIGDLITSFFLFDSAPGRDSFALTYVRFTNNYFQVPVSFAYMLNRHKGNFNLYAGLNIRTDFLTKSRADVRFDSAYKVPTTEDINAAHKTYTANVSKFVLTAEPYLEGSFIVHKNLGAFIQFRPFSFYSSPLDKRLTTSTGELFSFTFGASYSFK